MNFRVIYSQEAYNDLLSIYSYIAEEICEPNIAGNLVSRLVNAIESLSIFPMRHKRFESTCKTKNRRLLTVSGYNIIYDVLESTRLVSIIRIMCSRRDSNNIKTLN